MAEFDPVEPGEEVDMEMERLVTLTSRRAWLQEQLYDVNEQIMFIDSLENVSPNIDVEEYKSDGHLSSATLKAAEKAVGRLQWRTDLKDIFNGPGDWPGPADLEGQFAGTVAIVGKGIVLTAKHVTHPGFYNERCPRRGGKRISAAEIAKCMIVRFDYQKDAKSGRVKSGIPFSVRGFAEISKSGLDYSLLSLETNNKGESADELFGSLKLVRLPKKRDGEKLYIIHHPKGAPKKLGSGRFVRYDGNHVVYMGMGTNPGSSGAPVILKDGRIVAVHSLPRTGVDAYRIRRDSKILR